MSSTPTPDSPPTDTLARKLTRTEVQHQDSSIPGREIVRVLTEIPGGAESGWHIHPGEEVGYILAATVNMMVLDQTQTDTARRWRIPQDPAAASQRARHRPGHRPKVSTYVVEVDSPWRRSSTAQRCRSKNRIPPRHKGLPSLKRPRERIVVNGHPA